MTGSRVLGVVLVTVMSFGAAPSALAAPPPKNAPAPAASSLSTSLTGQARTDYEAGKLLFNDGDHAGAFVKFSSAYEQSKDPRLLWNMAACEKNRRHYAAAIELIRRYLSEGQTTLTPADKKDAEDAITTLEPLTGKLQVKVAEPGADVFVDDVKVGTTPLDRPIFLDLGEHRIRVAKAGFREAQSKVAISGGDTKPLEVMLEPQGASQGKVSVRAHDDDTISIDGKVVGSGTWDGALPSGVHHLRVSARGKRPHDADVVVEEGQAQVLSVTLESEKKGVPLWAWVAGGAVLAGGAAVGGYFLFRPSDTPAQTPVGTLSPGSVQASFPVRGF